MIIAFQVLSYEKLVGAMERYIGTDHIYQKSEFQTSFVINSTQLNIWNWPFSEGCISTKQIVENILKAYSIAILPI